MKMQEIKNRANQLAPADENVVLPAAIRAAAARSAEIHKAVYEEGQQAPEVVDSGEDGKQAEPTAAEAQAAQEVQDNNKAQPAEGSAEDWQHRYNSMKGRYDRAEDTVRSLNNRIANLENLLSTANQQPKPVAQISPDLQFRKISAEERETYGDDFIDVASRAAQEKLSPELTELRRQVTELSSKLGGVETVTKQTVEQGVRAFLTDRLPNWKEINRNPNFIAWLNLPDAYSGAIRFTMMNQAFQTGDGQRVLNFFNGFLSDEAASAPAPVPTSQTTPAPTGKLSLENLAAPGRAKAPAATQVPGEKETISTAQIAAFYANVQKGVYKGNDAEKNRLEKMIFDAQAEGRVV